MKFFQAPITIGLSPNTQRDDSLLAFKTLLAPWKWKGTQANDSVNRILRTVFPSHEVFTTGSGRAALTLLLTSMGIGRGDEVIVQAFTCVAVPDCVLWTGAKPRYVDIDRTTFNLSIADVEKKITSKTKAIIIQHTFGIPGDIEKLRIIANTHKLLLIEDCAHALGAGVAGKPVGTIGDGAILSFGRDKVISSVWGGALLLPKESTYVQKAKEMCQKLPIPTGFYVLRQLLHPAITPIVLALYHVGIGKLILVVLQKLNLLSKPVSTLEKSGKKDTSIFVAYAEALATLLHLQLKKIESFNTHRIQIAKYYDTHIHNSDDVSKPAFSENAIWHRYPLIVSSPQKILEDAKAKGVYLGNWYHNTIDPVGVDMESVGYVQGSCPVAEYCAKHIINLPTGPKISLQDAEKIIELLSGSR